MKKIKKALASLAIMGMTLTTASHNTFADTGITTARLFGSDRVGTAIAIADAGWTTADTAILAPSGDANIVDSLAAAPLAGKTSPILLTDNNSLNDATKAELIKLGVKNVYIVGAINQTAVDQVNALDGVTSTVLKGSDRIGTATAISSKLTAPVGSFVVGYGALADALSVASYAAAHNYSILVANPDGSLPVSEAAYQGSTVYIIGGPTLVADIPGATRLFGADRIATNQAVLQALTYNYDHIYVANSTDAHLVDSLLASSLAAKSNSPLVLSDIDGFNAPAAGLQSQLATTSAVTALGGHTLVSDAVVAEVTGITTPPTGWLSRMIDVTEVSLNNPTLSLTAGGATGTLVAVVSPADATNQTVIWTSSNAAVATVENGVVTPVGVGTAIITATTQAGAKTAASIVTVTTVTSGSLGVAADPSEFNQYAPLPAGKTVPVSTLAVAGIPTPSGNVYDFNRNARFFVALFNSYPALSTIPSQGLTITMNSDKNGVITNVDGYSLASNPNSVTVNTNSSGEVSVNNVELWKAQPGYKIVGYLPGSTNGATTLIEENLSTLTNFIGVDVPSLGSAGSQVAKWILPATSLPGNFEEFLGFNVNSTGQLQPMVASYYTNNNNRFAPFSTSVSTLAAGVFVPVEVAQVYASDQYSEAAVITVSNSLNSQTATVTTNFFLAVSGLVTIKISPNSVNKVLGDSQNITLNCQDACGNPVANETVYLGTGIPGLWITQVNDQTIMGSVNMGTTSSPSMQTVRTPVPLFRLGRLNATAYPKVSVTGLAASHLNDNSSPVIALTIGDDGTISITLADGNVNYVANAGSTSAINSYKTDLGTAIKQQPLEIFPDSDQTRSWKSIPLNWAAARI
jgi:putative cell wall-binding protein